MAHSDVSDLLGSDSTESDGESSTLSLVSEGSLDSVDVWALEEEEEEQDVVVEYTLHYIEVKTSKDHGKQETRMIDGVPKNSLYFRYCSK